MQQNFIIPPKHHSVLCLNPVGFHRIHYVTYGEPSKPLLIMVHGLSRTGRDFDQLAAALVDHYYIVCPDMVGRGKSDWLPEGVPYTYPQYLSDLTTLLAQVSHSQGVPETLQQKESSTQSDMPASPPSLTWLGTSMGGLLGMIFASMPNTPVTRLVINDVGPFLSNESLLKLRHAISFTPTFKDFDSALQQLKKTYAGFGALTDEDWLYTAQHMLRKNEDGTYHLHYDPKIGAFTIGSERFPNESSASTEANKETNSTKPSTEQQETQGQDATEQGQPAVEQHTGQPAGVNFWPYWLNIKCPVSILRGSESAILPEALLQGMLQTKPGTTHHIVKNTAHAPALMDKETINIIRDWLL